MSTFSHPLCHKLLPTSSYTKDDAQSKQLYKAIQNKRLSFHSSLSGFQTKLKLLSIGPSQGRRACIKGSKYILFEIQIKGHRNDQLGSLTKPAQFRPNALGCLASRSYGLLSRKIYFEPLMHAHSLCNESNFNFI